MIKSHNSHLQLVLENRFCTVQARPWLAVIGALSFTVTLAQILDIAVVD